MTMLCSASLSPSLSASLSTYVPTLLHSDKHADIKLIIGKEKLVRHGHSIILSARCPYFESNRPSSWKGPKAVYRLANVDPKVFDAALEFIYTGQAEITMEIVARLYEACTWMNLDELKDICVCFVQTNLHEDNAFQMLMATRTVDVLRQVALTFIHTRACSLLAQDSVTVLDQEMLLAAIPSGGMGQVEIIAWMCIVRWALFRCGLSCQNAPLLMFPKEPGRIFVSISNLSNQEDRPLGFYPRDDDLIINMSPSDHERLRLTLSPLLAAVRFEALSADCFCRYIEWTCLVPQEIVLRVYRHHAVSRTIPDTRFLK